MCPSKVLISYFVNNSTVYPSSSSMEKKKQNKNKMAKEMYHDN